MDTLADALKNVNLYDVKAYVRKAQNVVMNYTEMEAKVREATNNEPWGASSTLMNEIASGTYNYQLLNEIMPMIYKRFTEKSAEEWRQIYKALQLLEFLVKNGSEQVIDDARSHLSTIKMLRQFYYIDQNGKDQGINVRNRAKELADLLSDVDRIRQERKKARANRHKYSGVEGGPGSMGGLSGNGFGKKYGGFGSDAGGDFGGYSGGVYGDGGGFGGRSSSGFQDNSGGDKFEEYDEYDEGAAPQQRARQSAPVRQSPAASAAPKATPPPPKKAPEPVKDLFSFDDDEAPAMSASNGKGKQAASASALDDFGDLQSGGADDDDFDDFQAAPAPATQAPIQVTSSASSLSLQQPAPLSINQKTGIDSLVGFTSPPPQNASAFAPPMMSPTSTGGTNNMSSMSMMSPMNTGPTPTRTTSYAPSQPNYFTSVPANANAAPGSANPLSPMATGGSAKTQKKAGGDAFANIWSSASSGIVKTPTPTGNTPSLQAMAKEKASAGIWGAGQKPAAAGGSAASTPKQSGAAGDLEDLLG